MPPYVGSKELEAESKKDISFRAAEVPRSQAQVWPAAEVGDFQARTSSAAEVKDSKAEVFPAAEVEGFQAQLGVAAEVRGHQGLQHAAEVRGHKGLPHVAEVRGHQGLPQGLPHVAEVRGHQILQHTAEVRGHQGLPHVAEVRGQQGLQHVAEVRGQQGLQHTAEVKGELDQRPSLETQSSTVKTGAESQESPEGPVVPSETLDGPSDISRVLAKQARVQLKSVRMRPDLVVEDSPTAEVRARIIPVWPHPDEGVAADWDPPVCDFGGVSTDPLFCWGE